ncbi:ABC transporter ATP-binding protein [Anabaena sp. FACHB-709]|uniref:ABC transporter ATP-binding protein n=2 Tax=Nostocaceae TaxID=1162 RepID=A0A1Z4KLT2_ANAVA|nr:MULTISPECIES: methionine ABC transporter ATP-binding protein [Nostocaceae]BAY69927.1 ABC transporter ATP-binding protein [Trichormus variabilis NIES-23]HBW33389.1 methionine ABC transporter ATP-binding protein [Nostoc sp. UBA8866]MBD2173617.1 methionine ABC transporter ATP-binding protein [Anabaena cylindrica FACHB-318]MBD2265304.1 methionine ABC transporter ATP-binding protein [Anabaena sp. FACHB-709]MBD2275296.1 methionine ABC transporter ATP-binding protein [Nostoc sp. PCC 7120 = FACHB-4
MTAQLRLEQVNLFAKLKTQLQGYPILQDISFEINSGDRLAIIGPSGAGKTSLLRLINRLSEPNSGKIFLENQEYPQIPVIQLRQIVTLVLQEPKFLGMTVQQALAYPLILRGLTKETIQQRVSHWAEQLQIPGDWLGRTEVQLSAGQRQLVAIARALVIQPKILLLDEPTSHLDIGIASHLIQVLTQLTQTHHTTIVMVNSQLDFTQMFCNRLLYLQQGRLLVNQTASNIDWIDLQKRLMHAENQADEEWN